MGEPVFDCLCAGIVVADHVCAPIPYVPAPGQLVMTDRLALTIGGCAANVAVDLKKLGLRAGIAGCVGDDVFGRFVAESLAALGIDTGGLCVVARAETSQTMIVNVRGEDRRFIHSFGANAHFTAEHVPADFFARTRALYVGGYLLMPALTVETLAGLLAAAQKAGVLTALDVAVPQAADYMRDFERILPHVDVFLPNTDEAALITGEQDPVAQAERFHAAGARTVVITCGGEGAVLIGQRDRLRAGTYPVEFVDGSGCGDAFDAGFLFGLLEGYDARRCLEIASALGASCVRALGTTDGVFGRDEAERFVHEHRLEVTPL